MSITPSTHLMLLVFPAWGHIRPLLVLATKLMLERDDLILTVFIAPTMLDKAHSDLESHFQHSSLSKVQRGRIRLVAAFDTQEFDMFKVMGEFIAAYPAAYQTLLEGKPITCAKMGTTFDAVPAPTAIIMDFFALGQLRITREITGNSIPVVAWLSSTAASAVRLFGPQELGGLGDLYTRIEAEVQRTGKPVEEIEEKLFNSTNGSLINVPGLPPMYDHEFHPQDIPPQTPIASLVKTAHLFFKESDGAIITTSDVYEKPESVQAMRNWLGSWGKTIYGVGPLLPVGYRSSDLSSRGDTAVEVFLEKALQKYGEKSVLFISFGTVFWPSKPEYIEELIEALIEKELPFVFCYASPFATISEELQKKAESSGLGLLTKWAPQQYILTHKAVGWFLTHGGHGGITESLASGIPLISWPFMGDQPISTAQLVEHQKVAIELIEVRTGENGLKPIRRLGDRTPAGTREAVAREIREVIDHVRGPKGKEMAQNAERIKKEIAGHWEEGGVGKRELGAFLARYVDRVAA